jgi:2-phosphosulfolactate phosphatase
MTIDTSLFPAGFTPDQALGKRAAVIDVLRASASIIAALQHGAREIRLFETPEEAIRKRDSSAKGAVLLCGERGGKRIPGFDIGNSPSEYGPARIRGKTLWFTSTNGSRAVLKAARTAKQVIIAGFGNMAAAASTLISGGGDCILICAGKEGRFSLEDAACAGMLAERIRAETPGVCHLTDETLTAVLIYRHFKDDLPGLLQGCEHGRALRQIGMGRDLDTCAVTDASQVVPACRRGVLRLLNV